MNRDWRGTPIFPGSIVVYPVRFGSHVRVVEAEVVGFTKQDYHGDVLEVKRLSDHFYRTNTVKEKIVRLTRWDRVTVVQL